MTENTRNLLLSKLERGKLDTILRAAELVHLDIRDNVILPDTKIEFVDFPEIGVTSLVTPMEDGSLIEIATIGNEGFVGSSVLLGVEAVPEWAFCQVAGSSWRLPIKDFKRLLSAYPEFSKLCERYGVAVFSQVARNMGCNWTHSIEERCARWLLLTHDRVDGNRFYLTQEFLAMMLGVTRSGVNAAAGVLQKAGLITYVRGTITILDRCALEKVACPCYSAISSYFRATFSS